MIVIDDFGHMEMPAPCSGCGEVHELNDLYSCSDGRILCKSCKDGEG